MNILSLITCIAVCSIPVKNQSTPLISIRSESNVTGQSFTLGEIADITGADAASLARLESVKIGVSPLPGLSRTLFVSDINARLLYNHINPHLFQIQFPASVRITRTGTDISPDELLSAAQNALLNITQSGISAIPIQQPAHQIVLQGKHDIQAGDVHLQDEGSMATVPLTILVDGNPVRNLQITFNLKKTVSAIVAKTTLEAHTVITSDMLTMGNVDITNPAIITDPSQLIGKRTTRRIPLGAPFISGCVEKVMAVNYGATVTLLSQVGGVQITCPGVARSTGAIGDIIRVWSNETKTELSGTLLDNSIVKIEETK
jgi:flagella basal body P-ring formation protein FlgA